MDNKNKKKGPRVQIAPPNHTGAKEGQRMEGRFYEDRARLQFALEAGQLGDWDLDLKTQQITRSLQHDRIFGYETHLPEWTYEIFLDHVHPDDREMVREQFKRSLENGVDLEFESRIIKAGGKAAWIWVRGAVHRDAEARPARLFGVVRDITSGKEAEEELKRSEARYRALVEATSQAVWSWNPHTKTGDFADTQRWWAEVTGQAPQAQSAQEQTGWLEAVHPEDQERTQVAWTQAMATGIGYNIEYRLRTSKEDDIYVVSRAVPVYEPDGTVREWVGTLDDITETRRAEEALRTSEERFRVLTGVMPQLVWSSTPEGRIDFCNSRWLAYTGLTAEEIQGEGWADALHPDDKPVTFAAWRKAVETEQEYHVEQRLLSAEGEYRWFLTRALPFRNEAGQIVKWYGTCTDIQALKQAEERLEWERELLRKLFDRIPVMIVMYRPDTKVLQINKAFEQLTGWSTEEVSQIDLMEKCYPDPAYRESVRLYMASLQEGWRDITMTTKAGQPLESSWSNIRLSDETHIGIGIDITARKQAAEALSRSERLYRGIGESINYGIWVCEPDGRNIYASESFLKLVGLTQEECSAFGWGKVLHPDDAEATIAAWEECARTGNFWEREHRFWGVDGRWHHILARGVPIRDDEGQIIYWAGINLDIDAFKQTEQALRESEERLRASEAQLRLLNQTLEQRVAERTAELERSLKELDQFAYVASHDLKAPLRAVNHLATWIAEDAEEILPESSKIHLSKLQSRIQRMDKLLNDLLIYSRTGRRYYTKVSQVDTGALLAEIVELLAPPPTFTIAIQENMPTLSAYPVLLEVVFRNLIDNALKHHHRPDGRIDISARVLGDFIEFSVTDDGPGIDPTFHERIFQIFQTLQPRDTVESSGVGLAIVKKAVESQHGTISLISAPGQGSTFRFTWPVDTVLTQS